MSEPVQSPQHPAHPSSCATSLRVPTFLSSPLHIFFISGRELPPLVRFEPSMYYDCAETCIYL